MMSRWTIIHFYPLEDAHKCIFLEAIQVLLLSVLCKRRISVKSRKENTQWEKECSLFHISASLFLLCNICLHNFIRFPKNIQHCCRFFPISAVQYLPACSTPQISCLGKHCKPICRLSSLQCLLFLVTFLSFHSLPHFLAATSVYIALFFSPISISIRKWPCKNGLLA